MKPGQSPGFVLAGICLGLERRGDGLMGHRMWDRFGFGSVEFGSVEFGRGRFGRDRLVRIWEGGSRGDLS